MIIKKNKVPENIIAAIKMGPLYAGKNKVFSDVSIEDFFEIPSRKRDWFKSIFYSCLPLSIANECGITVKSPCDFTVIWDGGDENESLKVKINGETKSDIFPHFGSGTFSIEIPFILKTPEKVNLMTINPINSLTPNVNVMTGIIEADNLRYSFTLTFKVQSPNIITNFKKGQPIATIVPIPRYFPHSFKLENAENILTKSYINNERKAYLDFMQDRIVSGGKKKRNYFFGKDVYDNKFKDHQIPGMDFDNL